MKKIIDFFKTPLGIGIIAVVAITGLFFTGRAIYKTNNARTLQRALDDVNARIAQSRTQRGASVSAELISEHDALVEIIKKTIIK